MDFTAKTFTVTINGTDWTGQPVTVTKTVKTFGNEATAYHTILTQDFPSNIRKVEGWTAEQVG